MKVRCLKEILQHRRLKQFRVTLGCTGTSNDCNNYRSLLRIQLETNCDTMNINQTVLFLSVIVTLCCVNPSNAQFGNFFRDLFRPLNNILKPVTNGFRGLFRGSNSNTINALRSKGRDPLFPADCGKDDDGKGKLCFGDPDLCRASKLSIEDVLLSQMNCENPKKKTLIKC